MIYVLILIISHLLYSRDAGVLLITSTQTLNSVCEYVKSENIKLSFSVASTDISDICKDITEAAGYIRFPYYFFSGFNKTESYFRNFKTVDGKRNLLKCLYKSYVSTPTSGLIFEGLGFSEDIFSVITDTYLWIGGGIVNDGEKSYFYFSSNTAVVNFELVRSTDQIFVSSSDFFIIDERVFNDITYVISSMISAGYNIKSVKEMINIVESSKLFDKVYGYLVANDYQKNYLSYLNKLAEDVELYSTDDSAYQYLCDLTIYYNELSDYSLELYFPIRDITLQMYSLINTSLPSFIYMDFLKESLRKFSIEKNDNHIIYFSDKYTFEVSRDGEDIVFKVTSSTSLPSEIQIYADINRRAAQGSTYLFSLDEKMDDESAWEYAMIVFGQKLILYSSKSRGYAETAKLPVIKKDNEISFSVPVKNFSGNPFLWRYTVIVKEQDGVGGFLKKLSDTVITSPDV